MIREAASPPQQNKVASTPTTYSFVELGERPRIAGRDTAGRSNRQEMSASFVAAAFDQAAEPQLRPVPRLMDGKSSASADDSPLITVSWTPAGGSFHVARDLNPSRPATGVFDPLSAQASSIRILGHRLRQAGDPQIILITSPRSQEGKTVCALNLARAMAEDTSAHVMLIEANRTRPVMASMLAAEPPQCLSAQLEAHRDDPYIPWSVMSALAPNLHLLIMNRTPARPGLINASLFGDLTQAAREEHYRHVIIDTPHVLGSAEVSALVEHVDVVLFTAWAGVSKRTELQDAARLLATPKLMGVVLMNG